MNELHKPAFNEWKQHYKNELLDKVKARTGNDELVDAVLEHAFLCGFECGLQVAQNLLAGKL